MRDGFFCDFMVTRTKGHEYFVNLNRSNFKTTVL
jgi:hypothetical protein